MALRYRVDGSVSEPIAVECDPIGYPHFDAEGRKQYENTHFDRIDDAWAKLLAETAARVSLSTRTVLAAKARLATAEASLERASLVNDEAQSKHLAWKAASR